MGAYGSMGASLEDLFLGTIRDTRSEVMALYRKNAAGEYVPVLWMPHIEGAEPAHVARASDLASFLRGLDVESFEMDCDTFRDGPVRRGLQSFGVNTLLVVPLQGNAAGRYYLSAGTSGSFSNEDRERIAGVASYLERLIESANLSARVRGSVLPVYDEDEAITGQAKMPGATQETFSMLSMAVSSGSFERVVSHAHNLLRLPGACITVEDPDGLELARHPTSNGPETTASWLCQFPRLPYLDWMEDSHRPVLVPDESGTAGSCRLVIPLFGRKNFHGLVSVFPMTREEAVERSQTLIELRLAAMYLVRCKEASRSHVLSRSLKSVENERARIAIELHDETSQSLVALKVRLATAQHALALDRFDDATSIIEDCSRISDEILNGVNRLAADLRPSELAYLGLRPAIEAVAEARLTRAGIQHRITGNATSAHFGALAERMLLTGVVEAISNCARHSQANEVEIIMHEEEGWFSIAVRDDGRGFNIVTNQRTGVGIQTMRDCSRAIGGDFWIGSDIGKGTTVRFSVPYSLLEEAEGE